MTHKLLTRDEFRNSVFKRDNYKCVICGEPAADAHHIMERRLFEDSGYYLANGSSVCGPCHIKAEQTLISCEELRVACDIRDTLLPPHLEIDQRYDKWGNPILDNGLRLHGELFGDESVQKILSEVLHLFTSRVKYPRTYHLPWSPGASNDDKILENTECYSGKQIIVTEKFDGENTTFYQDYLHARSVEYHPHPSRTYIKSLHARVAKDIPTSWRVCGENLYAKHSIAYLNLPDYFLVFSIWNEKNICLSWEDTKEWSSLLGLSLVPVIYAGVWNEKEIKAIKCDTGTQEGYVVRLAESFAYKNFKKSVSKYVRTNHITTDEHWMNSAVVPNKLKRV